MQLKIKIPVLIAAYTVFLFAAGKVAGNPKNKQLIANAQVPVEIRFCSFPDGFKTGILFINGQKKTAVKSGSVFVFSFPADSSMHLKIKMGKNEYIQDGNFIIEKNGGVVNVEYFFLLDSGNLDSRSVKSSKFKKQGWIGVDYWSAFRVRESTKPYKKGLGKAALGGYRDDYRCLPSGGYVWSDAAQACVRIWEAGILYQKIIIDSAISDANVGHVVFSPDGEWTEIFTTEKWDKNCDKRVWLLRKYDDEWRYNGRMLIEIKKGKGNEKLNIYINKIKSYTIIKN
jgi:hypothetical protein